MKIAIVLLFISVMTRAQDTTFNCNGWSQFATGSYLVENNIWGQGSITDFTQCIYHTGTDNDVHFGWNWNWPIGNSDVKAYPEVIFGKKPWSGTSTNEALPIKIQNLDEFYVVYDLDMVATGSYNLAFEFWVTIDSMSSETGITTEVMIWMDNNLISPAGNIIGTVSFDGFDYYLYQANWDSWTYFAFISAVPQYSAVLGIHHFVNHLVNQGMLDPNEYFADFELGNEVVYGTGQTDIQQYEIYVNSSPLNVVSIETLPGHYNLSYNYPNPFNPKTTINFSTPTSEFVSVNVYDINGTEIITLISETLSIGEHNVEWNGTDYPSGIYIARISSENYLQTVKMLLVK